jgi:CheY-like chemotaxis protein
VPILIAGRKLLLADDSIAIQKVIDLTFTDEGMEVTTVGDGQDALEKLNQFTPDVVLADVFMPGVDGYELCKFIKQSERFSGVPVMLLIGTFEPFDEAEAKLAGADDVVTKPFQSIRQLVSRVGSLLGDQPAAKDENASKYSTLGLDQADENVEVPNTSAHDEHANVRVFVEAPIMSESESESHPDEHHCPPNIELQTADTQKLDPDVPAELAADDTLELEAVPVAGDREIPFEEVAFAPDEHMSYQPAPAESGQGFDDSVLDLGDVDSFASVQAEDDFVLDLDAEPAGAARAWEPVEAEAATEVEAAAVSEAMPEEPASETPVELSSADTQEWAIVTPAVEPQNWEGKTEESTTASPATASELSPEAIEAISRRVVEHLSEKVVREIAWEVVPELSELLIKKRLEEQK